MVKQIQPKNKPDKERAQDSRDDLDLPPHHRPPINQRDRGTVMTDARQDSRTCDGTRGAYANRSLISPHRPWRSSLTLSVVEGAVARRAGVAAQCRKAADSP